MHNSFLFLLMCPVVRAIVAPMVRPWGQRQHLLQDLFFALFLSGSDSFCCPQDAPLAQRKLLLPDGIDGSIHPDR